MRRWWTRRPPPAASCAWRSPFTTRKRASRPRWPRWPRRWRPPDTRSTRGATRCSCWPTTARTPRSPSRGGSRPGTLACGCTSSKSCSREPHAHVGAARRLVMDEAARRLRTARTHARGHRHDRRRHRGAARLGRHESARDRARRGRRRRAHRLHAAGGRRAGRGHASLLPARRRLPHAAGRLRMRPQPGPVATPGRATTIVSARAWP